MIVNLDPRTGQAPYQLVEAAVDHKNRAEREARRGRGTAPDSYWCVFDVDDHPRLDDAVRLAEENGVNTAISNPCFEIWLLLHHHDQRSWQDRSGIQHQLKTLTGIDKTLSDAQLEALLSTHLLARDRAIALDAMHIGNGTVGTDCNPSSGLWRLVDTIQNAG